MNFTEPLRRAVFLALMISCPGVGFAATRTWNVVSGDWFDAASWLEASVPEAGDQVVIGAGGTARLTNATPALASLALSGTLVFTNWNTTLSASNVTIASGGVMTLPVAYANNAMSNNVVIVCSNLTISTGGKIDVSLRGYLGAQVVKGHGHGPGAGIGGGTHYGSGGSHGGYGGQSSHLFASDKRYGAGAWPVYAGSGGGGGYSGTGGSGGGAVRIAADGVVDIDGSIFADGGFPSASWCGGGSGGSIAISCQVIEGGGTLSARGGASIGGGGGGGGGGRIAITYDPLAQAAAAPFGLALLAGGGASATTGGPGTVWLPDDRFLGERIERLQGQVLGFSEYRVDTLLITNTSVSFPADGFLLEVTNSLVIAAARLDCGGATLVTQALHLIEFAGDTDACQVTVGGDLRLLNNAGLHIYSARTNGVPGAYGARLDVAGAIEASGNSWLYPYAHPINGATMRIGAGDVRLAAGSGIRADGCGYKGGSPFKNGYGPGAGRATSNYGSGGAYGGYAGQSDFGMGGMPYGSVDVPSDPGSGGAGGLWGAGQDGGGFIGLFISGDLVCNGTISANGSEANSIYHGSGSGGGIQISCARLIATNGLISARGGNTLDKLGCGGSGGRIAINYADVAEPVTLSVRADAGTVVATATALYRGDLGTVKLPDNRLLVEENNAWLCGEIHGITAWSPSSLTLNNAWLRFPHQGAEVRVQGNLIVRGASGRIEAGGGEFMNVVVPVRSGSGAPVTLSVGGDAIVTNGGALVLHSTVVADPETEPGALFQVGGRLQIGNNSALITHSHPTNGASPRVSVKRLVIDAGGAWRASLYDGVNPAPAGFAWGYKTNNLSGGGWLRIPNHIVGFGPGGGTGNEGGSYGGRGGAASGGLASLSKIYGSSNAPALPGSGGAGSYSYGGFGGGLAVVEASREVVINGEVNMNGGTRTGVYSAGGAGGGILIRAPRVTGVGALRARGGNGNTNAGGGGGGRIAVWSTVNMFVKANADVSGGTGANGYGGGEAGSVVWGPIPPAGTTLILR